MDVNEIVNIIVNNGVAVFIVGYFVYRDYKFNENLVKSLTEITVTLKEMKEDINEIRKGGDDK